MNEYAYAVIVRELPSCLTVIRSYLRSSGFVNTCLFGFQSVPLNKYNVEHVYIIHMSPENVYIRY